MTRDEIVQMALGELDEALLMYQRDVEMIKDLQIAEDGYETAKRALDTAKQAVLAKNVPAQLERLKKRVDSLIPHEIEDVENERNYFDPLAAFWTAKLNIMHPWSKLTSKANNALSAHVRSVATAKLRSDIKAFTDTIKLDWSSRESSNAQALDVIYEICLMAKGNHVSMPWECKGVTLTSHWRFKNNVFSCRLQNLAVLSVYPNGDVTVNALYKPNSVDESVLEPPNSNVKTVNDFQTMFNASLNSVYEMLANIHTHDDLCKLATSRCIICGKSINDERSMKRLIGPECWRRGRQEIAEMKALRAARQLLSANNIYLKLIQAEFRKSDHTMIVRHSTIKDGYQNLMDDTYQVTDSPNGCKITLLSRKPAPIEQPRRR